MNNYQRLSSILSRHQQGVAQITGDLGGGAWAARSQGGSNLVLSGQAAIGNKVFYDIKTNKILSQAPDLRLIELGI